MFRPVPVTLPEDVMFQLTAEEDASLRSQFVTSTRGGRDYRFHAQGELTTAGESAIAAQFSDTCPLG